MNINSIQLQIKILEEQLRVLKSAVSNGGKKESAMADLYGLFEGRLDISFEEIQKAEFTFKAPLT